MSFTDDILSGDLYSHFASKLADEERAECDKHVRELLENFENLNDVLKLKMSDNKGRMAFLDDLLYLFNDEEGHKKWQEKD